MTSTTILFLIMGGLLAVFFLIVAASQGGTRVTKIRRTTKDEKETDRDA